MISNGEFNEWSFSIFHHQTKIECVYNGNNLHAIFRYHNACYSERESGVDHW